MGTRGNASLFTKQIDTFASVIKDSEENTAKRVRTSKGRLRESSS